MAELFTQVAKPTATMETAGAFLGRWRLMSIDGMAWDIPDIPANAAAFGYPRAGKDGAPGAFPKAQVVTVSECASHAAVLSAIGPFALKAGGERALGRRLYPKLEEDWLLIATAKAGKEDGFWLHGGSGDRRADRRGRRQGRRPSRTRSSPTTATWRWASTSATRRSTSPSTAGPSITS